VGHLVAICCHAGGGVAVAEAAGAAGGVVGLQVKPARLAPGHGEETGAHGVEPAEAWGTTAASPGGTPVVALSEPSPSGPEGCSPTASPASHGLCRERPRKIPIAKPP